ncbi:hypothetical protein DFH11DRAFT_1731114 [Phellopilus nigrolimitatus]|nr:hypothetical protein DFH11DRAFT_1731114 [Phellopilus nigrolimitatus]
MDMIAGTCAGKDLSTGPRFNDALHGAASMLSNTRNTGLTPRESVDESRKVNKLIIGIGHKIKSENNFDLRVELAKEYREGRKSTLILNVDRGNAVCFVGLLRFRPFPRTALSKPRWLPASPITFHATPRSDRAQAKEAAAPREARESASRPCGTR